MFVDNCRGSVSRNDVELVSTQLGRIDENFFKEVASQHENNSGKPEGLRFLLYVFWTEKRPAEANGFLGCEELPLAYQTPQL